jgi:hypothetical protein
VGQQTILTDQEWRRLRVFLSNYTAAEIEKKFPGNLARVLSSVARTNSTRPGNIRLSTELITEALKYCKQPGASNEPKRGVLGMIME